MIRTALIAALILPLSSFDEQPEVQPVEAPLVFELGGSSPVLSIPRDEHLQFSVHVAVGPVGATVGKVLIDSGVDPYMESMLLLAPPVADGAAEAPKRETGRLKAKATGSYLWYDLETTLDTRFLPQDWPQIAHLYSQSGSENRRRESCIGLLGGKSQSTYRGDTRRGAPSGQRIWGALKTREIPAGTVDMLGAVFLARTLLSGEEQELVFPLLDKTRLWQMTLKRGAEKRVTVPMGSYDAVEILLIPGTWPGEPAVEAAKFRGLFGIRGSIHLWVEKHTGVPIRITGTMPAGPLTIDCDIALTGATGTPEAFKEAVLTPAEPK